MVSADMDTKEDISDYERMRAQNVKELEQMLAEFSEDIDESVNALIRFDKPKHITNKKRKRTSDDETFRFTGHIPLQKRKSSRLSNTAPKYTYEDLPNEDYRGRPECGDIDDLEEVVYRKKRFVAPRRSTGIPCDVVPVDQITPVYISKIAIRTTIKVYSQQGTSCHQCRQKTLDSKTYCRSGQCIGVRGQFCGVCLKNRYGEDAKDALLNPNWACPPCRGLCNCSICRTREGKRPTGILAPIAFRYGHKSVKDFLISLKGEGDFASDPPKDIVIEKVKKYNCGSSGNCDHLLMGFSKDGKPVWRVKKKEFCFCDDDDDLVGFDSEHIPVMTKI